MNYRRVCDQFGIRLILHHMAFSFERKPYWRPHYEEEMETIRKNMLTDIGKINRFVRKIEYSDYIKGFLIEYRYIYIIEICSGENKLKCLVDQENKYIKIDETQDNERNRLKVENLVKAVDYAFGEYFCRDSYKHTINAQFVKELNRIIGHGLFDTAGNYRKKPAKPSGYEYYYMEPEKIEEHMNILFQETEEEVKHVQEFMDQIEVAVRLFSRFLGIHPFSNGNGRTARILLSSMLITYTFAPLSLFSSYFSYESNTEYLYCLEEAHAYTNSNLLHSLIIESLHRFCRTFLTALDVEEKDLL